MKKLLVIFSVVFLFFGLFVYIYIEKSGDILGTRKRNYEPTPTPIVKMPDNTVALTSDNHKIWATWMKIKDPNKLVLLPNFEAKDSARNLIVKDKCARLINAGFYTGDAKPLGMFISEGNVIRSYTKNNIIPAIFTVTYDKKTDIVYGIPEKNARIALQTGPMLIENGYARKLSLRSDGYSRRTVVGVTSGSEIIFIVFYNKDSLFSGPNLVDLPEDLVNFQAVSGIKIRYAANMDGGSATAFFDKHFFLEEISYIGGYFCEKE